jgi:uncharacterized peroxidase-related enzyme
MARINPPALEDAPAETQPVLEKFVKRFGFVPNLFRLMSMNPNVLAAFMGIQGNLAKTMDLKTIEAMGMVVSEGSGCDYCLATHTYLGTRFGKAAAEEMVANRYGKSSDPKIAAAILFAKSIADKRGKVSDKELADIRAAGFSDADIIAIAGLTAQFLMTNFMNNVSQIDVDFPAAGKAA